MGRVKHTCRYTPGTPCLACEAERTRMHRQRQLLDLARPFIRAQGEVLLLVGAAVEYGRRQERLRGIPLAAQADGGRFDFVEIDFVEIEGDA